MELTLDQALQKGIEAHKAGKVQEADRYYTAIIKAQPKHPDANHNMGVLAVGVDKVEQALSFFKTALEANPKIEQYWLSYIDALTKLDRVDHARTVLDQAKSKGVKSEAFKRLENSLNKRPGAKGSKLENPTQDQLEPLISLYNQGQLQPALDQALQLLNEFPSSSVLYNIYGVVNAGLQKYDEAVNAYKQAIIINPNYPDPYNNMGVALKVQGKLVEAIEAYKKAISLKPNYADAYNNMGVSLKEQGKLDEAIEAYKKTLFIKPAYAQAYYNMGNALKDRGKLDEAIEAYSKTLSIKPDHGSAKHMVSALTGHTNETAPREYVENLFDGYSKKFEVSLVDELEYKIPKLIRDILIKSNSNESVGSVLDLGCGTGLFGLEIRDHCSQLEGIDLSNRMLEIAKNKNIYDKLSQSDILEYLLASPLDFDYYIALDVFIYVGELAEIFRLIKSRNKRPAHLVFSTEHTDLDGYHILKSGRYSHSKTYIESLCKKFDYNVAHFSTTNLRKEKEHFLTGGIYILNF